MPPRSAPEVIAKRDVDLSDVRDGDVVQHRLRTMRTARTRARFAALFREMEQNINELTVEWLRDRVRTIHQQERQQQQQ